MLVVYSDLDGTLLDHETYSFDAARQALDRLQAHAVPLIFCTSKTRAETEIWRARLDNTHPFIVENGGALFIPQGYFPMNLQAPARRDGYEVFEFGDPYVELVGALRAAAEESSCQVRGFHDMTVEEVGESCGIPTDQARKAREREYDEPFEITAGESDRLLAAIERRGKRWTRGGRFYHVLGANDKGLCVGLLSRLYRQTFREVSTAGLGDSPNDAAFLRVVDIPVIIRSEASTGLQSMIPGARVTDLPGPQGWNRAVLDILRSPP